MRHGFEYPSIVAVSEELSDAPLETAAEAILGEPPQWEDSSFVPEMRYTVNFVYPGLWLEIKSYKVLTNP